MGSSSETCVPASLLAVSSASRFALASASLLAFSSASFFALASASLLACSSASFFVFSSASGLASQMASAGCRAGGVGDSARGSRRSLDGAATFLDVARPPSLDRSRPRPRADRVLPAAIGGDRRPPTPTCPSPRCHACETGALPPPAPAPAATAEPGASPGAWLGASDSQTSEAEPHAEPSARRGAFRRTPRAADSFEGADCAQLRPCDSPISDAVGHPDGEGRPICSGPWSWARAALRALMHSSPTDEAAPSIDGIMSCHGKSCGARPLRDNCWSSSFVTEM
mmetsp:Transcript_13762/g.36357  ORF Transcript_13762/g.36357 Transcript_13762/m.36357 type:complete len:284 (-) Transcript_13762:337-1188(-)